MTRPVMMILFAAIPALFATEIHIDNALNPSLHFAE
jgi:hypothetical protein